MRPSRPWYCTSHDAWYVEVGGKQVKLAKGKANKQAALLEWHRLQSGQGQPTDVAEPQVSGSTRVNRPTPERARLVTRWLEPPTPTTATWAARTWSVSRQVRRRSKFIADSSG